MVKVIRYTQFV